MCIQIKTDLWVQAVYLHFWVQMSTGWQLSCVQAEALICYRHLALAHCKKYGSVVNISRLLFSNVQEKTVGENHILQLQLSQIFSSLIQCTDIFCASHLDFEVNYKISCYDRTKRIFLVPQLVNQIRGTWLFCVFSVKTNRSLVLEVKGYIFSFGTWNEWISATSLFQQSLFS